MMGEMMRKGWILFAAVGAVACAALAVVIGPGPAFVLFCVWAALPALFWALGK